MRNFLLGAGCVGWVLMGSVCHGIVNFAEFSVEQVVSPGVVWEAVGTSATGHLAGVATYPAPSGPVYMAYDRGAGQLDMLKGDVQEGSAVKLTDTAEMALDLAAPYRQEFELEAGFAYLMNGDQVYFSDGLSAGGEKSLLKVNGTTGLARVVSRTTVTEAIMDYAAMDANLLVASYQTTETGAVGILDNNGQWAGYVWESDLLAAAGTAAADLRPIAAGAGYGTDDVYVYCAGDGMVFHIQGLAGAEAVITHLADPNLAGAAVTDIAVDELGNMFGYDDTGARLLIYRKADGAVFEVPMDVVATAGGLADSRLTPVPLRGLAARRAGGSLVDLFVVTSDAAVGLVRVRFGDSDSGVADWRLY